LGNYWGIRESGRLVAMAGERLHLNGYTEISAVCTHPDFQGKGYAKALLAVVANHITNRGETPFLHAWIENYGAIRVYEKLGFKQRRVIHLGVIRKVE
jgi:predicted GNAT family acetyltransferase